MTDELLAVGENLRLEAWRALARHPAQLNALHEADAELVRLDGTRALAATVDTLEEELACGLYRDPETVGWVGAAASLSDLAAVGATPLGLLTSVRLPAPEPDGWLLSLAHGLDAAARAAETFVRGGDTGQGAAASVTVCASGRLGGGPPRTRRGLEPGDRLYATGPLGDGAAWAAHALLGAPWVGPSEGFRPRARWRQIVALRPHLRSAMDTSDGLVATLDQLARLNEVGIELTEALTGLLSPAARAVATALGVPALTVLAVCHGEYEVVLGVPRAEEAAFLARARAFGDMPVPLGRVAAGRGLVTGGARPRPLDGAAIRDLAALAGADPRDYLARLRRLTG